MILRYSMANLLQIIHYQPHGYFKLLMLSGWIHTDQAPSQQPSQWSGREAQLLFLYPPSHCSGLAVCRGQAAPAAFPCQGSLDSHSSSHCPINARVLPPPLLKGSGIVALSPAADTFHHGALLLPHGSPAFPPPGCSR